MRMGATLSALVWPLGLLSLALSVAALTIILLHSRSSPPIPDPACAVPAGTALLILAHLRKERGKRSE